MSDMMTFPATVEEFMEQYKIVDDEKVYTNGADLVPIFRMMQWFEHVSATDKNVGTNDTINRQQAIDALADYIHNVDKVYSTGKLSADDCMDAAKSVLDDLPSAQPDNQVHLCDSCSYTYPECPSVYTDMIFGNGRGNDNICACSKYLPLIKYDTDTISRQAALDIFDDYNVAVENGQIEAYSRDRKRLCDLPSAQPEIIHCKDCIHNKEPDFGFCEWANHHVSANSCCADVFHAERRTDG